MKKHILDKIILRDLFWFIVIPHNMKECQKENNKVINDIIFSWKDKNGSGTCHVRDKTLSQAKEVATSFGWKEFSFFNYKTWSNIYVILK